LIWVYAVAAGVRKSPNPLYERGLSSYVLFPNG